VKELIMATAKQEMARIIENQPEDSSYEEILKELAFARMVARGLADSDAGRTISNEEMQKRIASWQR
jgi:predicted transcriptional regulator